jgi:hypothetical protein
LLIKPYGAKEQRKMLTQVYQVNTPLEASTCLLTPFLAKAMHCWLTKDTFLAKERGIGLTGDPERFQLVINESVKVGHPINRDEALYWIEIVKARALAPIEVIGWVKVN